MKIKPKICIRNEISLRYTAQKDVIQILPWSAFGGVKRILFLTGLAVYFQMSCGLSFAQNPDKTIRVKIFPDSAFCAISIKGDYLVKESGSDRILKCGPGLRAKVSGYKNGVILGGQYLSDSNIFIKSGKSGCSIELNGRRFKGGVQVIKRDNGLLSVINYLDLEDYVKGISVRETSHYWPMEALKAETVAFRTFARYRMEQFKNKEWDVTDDVYSQVYGGQEAERYRITEAVDKTKGEVLFFAGKILPAFYHSTCAGSTEDASILWDIDLAPLKGVVCGFCSDSPHFSWKSTVSKEKIKQLLEKQGRKIKKLEEIVVTGREKSGRVSNLNIVTEEKDIEITAKDFRSLIGSDIIKSTNFRISSNNGDLVFDGLGWGHGAGLCQWGAYFMAKAGFGYLKILNYYYPGSTLVRDS